MLILVTGATGFIGRFAVRALAGAGHDVRALVRDKDRAKTVLGQSVELVVGTVLDSASVRGALDGCDGLLHAAAVYSYDRRDVERMSADTPTLARAVLEAALDAKLTRVVDIASVVVYTTVTDRVTTSTRIAAATDPTWKDPYCRAKVSAEAVAAAFEASGLPRVTLHPSRVLGPEDSGPGTSGASVIALLKGGLTTDARGGWVDVRDVADATVAAFAAPVGTHAIVSANSMSYRELSTLLDQLTGTRRRRTFMSFAATRFTTRLNDRLGGRLIEAPTAGAMEYILTAPPVDGSTGEALLGRPYRPFEETLTDAIRWWIEHAVIDRKLAGKIADQAAAAA